MSSCNFGLASANESTVFGACRPDYPSESPTRTAVNDWIAAMQTRDIERVCCLLDQKLNFYNNLLGRYQSEFGAANVCHAPIPDYQLVSRRELHQTILPFLRDADDASERVVVHCSAGQGRTGHILALWLACERGYDLGKAVGEVRKMGRNPPDENNLSHLV